MARLAWQYNHAEGLGILELIRRRSLPGFAPAGNAAPAAYRGVYRLLGFRLAETIAVQQETFRTPSYRLSRVVFRHHSDL